MPRFNSAPVLNPGDSINRGLVGFWPLNHAAGGIARDLSPFARHGTLVNFGYTSTSGWATGRTGRVLNFDGSNDYVSVERIPPLPYITVSCWVKANGSNSSFIISKNFSGTVPFQLSPAPSGTYGGFAFYGGPWICTNVATDIRNDGKWHHVAGTFDGTTLKYYIDGRLDASAAYSGTLPSNTSAMTIGVYLNDGGHFTGPISALRLHNRALSVSELARLYRDPWAGTLRRRKLALLDAGGTPVTLAPGAGSLALAGQAATLKVGVALAPGAGALALAGQSAALKVGATLTPGAGSLALAGQAASLKLGITLAAGAGSLALAGQAASLRVGLTLAPGAGSLVLAGQSAGVILGTPLTAGTGSLTIAGQPATLVIGTTLLAGTGALALAGQAATLRLGTALTPGPGSLVLSGQGATLRIGVTLTPGAGALILAGQAATLAGSPDGLPAEWLPFLAGRRLLRPGAPGTPRAAAPRTVLHPGRGAVVRPPGET